MTDLRPEREHIPQQSQRQILGRFALQWYSKRKRCSMVEVLLVPRLRLLLMLMCRGPEDAPSQAAPSRFFWQLAALHCEVRLAKVVAVDSSPRCIASFGCTRRAQLAACRAASRASSGRGCRSWQLAALHCAFRLDEVVALQWGLSGARGRPPWATDLQAAMDLCLHTLAVEVGTLSS